MSDFVEAIKVNTEGIEHLSAGFASPELCSECPEHQDESVGDEGHFSWHPCECCGSPLGGLRYAAHGFIAGGAICHLDVCADCLVFIANGDEPETWGE